MKISDLIVQLERWKKSDGDLPVWAYGPQGADAVFTLCRRENGLGEPILVALTDFLASPNRPDRYDQAK